MDLDNSPHPRECDCIFCQINRLPLDTGSHESTNEEFLDPENLELEDALDLLYDAVEQFGHVLDSIPSLQPKRVSGWRLLANQAVPGRQFLSLDEFIDLLINSIMMNSSDLRDFTDKVNRYCLALKGLTIRTVYTLN